MNKNCFVSWSGGKDSCLALYKARGLGYNPVKLLTMFSKENNISTAHRLKKDIIKEQAMAIGIDCIFGEALFSDYEDKFISNLKYFKKQDINYGVFGDIDILDHRKWEENVCNKVKIEAILPLWQKSRKEIVKEFLRLGFKAKIVVVNTKTLDKSFLGKELTLSLIDEIEQFGADACGENGEYHTVVYDGPIFKNQAKLNFSEDVILIGDSYAQIEVGTKY